MEKSRSHFLAIVVAGISWCLLASCSPPLSSESVLASSCSVLSADTLRQWDATTRSENNGDPVLDDSAYCGGLGGRKDAVCSSARLFCLRPCWENVGSCEAACKGRNVSCLLGCSQSWDSCMGSCNAGFDTCISGKHQATWLARLGGLNCSFAGGKCYMFPQLASYQNCAKDCAACAGEAGINCEKNCKAKLDEYVSGTKTAPIIECHKQAYCASACENGWVLIDCAAGARGYQTACREKCPEFCATKGSVCARPECVEFDQGDFCPVCNNVINSVVNNLQKGQSPIDICRIAKKENLPKFQHEFQFSAIRESGNVNCNLFSPCNSGEIKCGDQCVNPLEDYANCGRCNYKCGRQEDCEGGTCVFLGT